MTGPNRYWYHFQLKGWFDAAGKQLNVSSAEPVIRESDYKAAITALESQLAATQESNTYLTNLHALDFARIAQLEAALRYMVTVFGNDVFGDGAEGDAVAAARAALAGEPK